MAKGISAGMPPRVSAAPVSVTSDLQMVPIKQIKPYHRNVRKNDATVEQLVEIIPKVGFNVPLVLDRKNVIVKGHSRWKAAVRLGMKTLPCVYTDADEETIKLDRLADNRIQELSSWDEEGLAKELASLNLDFVFDLEPLNFNFKLPSFEVPGAGEEPPASNGDAAAEPANQADEDPPEGEPFITEDDVGKTRPNVDAADYLEVVCNNCGNHLFVKKG
jgi:ParB-like nuclease domain